MQEQPRGLYLAGSWGNRPRTAERIGKDLLATLEQFEQLDRDVLTGWVKQSRAELPITREAVTRLVKLSEMPAEPAGMGWAPAIVSGGLRGDQPGLMLAVTDGTSSENPIVLGQVRVEPTEGWEGDSFLLSHAEGLVDTLVRRWSPDWLALTCRPYRRAQRRGRRLPQVGARTWLADTFGPLPVPLPEGAQVQRLHQGHVIDLRPAPDAMPEVSAVAQVAGWLDRVGVIHDVPQWQQQGNSLS